MKKLLSMLVFAVLAMQVVVAGDVVTMNVKQLPQEAQQFIKNYFPNAKVELIKIDKGWITTEYEVKLENQVELEFDSKGNWSKVDCGRRSVPEGLVPGFAKDYVKANFPQARINEIKREGSRIKIELTNDVSITFNKNGKVVNMGD